jgi:P2-related tail formation protein
MMFKELKGGEAVTITMFLQKKINTKKENLFSGGRSIFHGCPLLAGILGT